jgi:FMN phosphatase YigB (HAD superfamily)
MPDGCADTNLGAHAFELYWSRSRRLFRPFDDVLPLLRLIQGRFKTAVITNGPADTQLDKLKTAGLAESFDLFVASGAVRAAKPDAAIFLHALEALEVEPQRTWHVGDWPPADIAGARAAGLAQAIWLNRRGSVLAEGDPRPHHEVTSLLELLPLLGLEGD